MASHAPAPIARSLVARGLAEHRAGRFEAAEALYRQGLAADPNIQEGWRLLGVVLQQRGAAEASLEPIGRALELGRNATDLSNLANALNQLARSEQAAAAAAEALALE
ncbi:MAG: tetratricopeptide repeat protein, partial [Caulobacteraceae bacterium]